MGHLGRCLAPDLMGLGRYRFAEHRHHLDGLWEQLGVTDRVVLVGHGGVPCRETTGAVAMVLPHNAFVEHLPPAGSQRPLAEPDMAAYHLPHLQAVRRDGRH